MTSGATALSVVILRATILKALPLKATGREQKAAQNGMKPEA